MKKKKAMLMRKTCQTTLSFKVALLPKNLLLSIALKKANHSPSLQLISSINAIRSLKDKTKTLKKR